MNGDNDFTLGSGVGEITLNIDEATDEIFFDYLGADRDLYTEYEGIMEIAEDLMLRASHKYLERMSL